MKETVEVTHKRSSIPNLPFMTNLSLWILECPFFFGAFEASTGRIIRRHTVRASRPVEPAFPASLEEATEYVRHLSKREDFRFLNFIEDHTLDDFEDNTTDFILDEDDFITDEDCDKEEFDAHK